MFIQKSIVGNNKFGAYLGTIIIVIIISQLLGSIPLATVVSVSKLSKSNTDSLGTFDPVALGIDQNFFLLLMIVPFALGLLALWFGVTSIHKKKVLDVITGRNLFYWKRVLFGAYCF